MEQNCQKQQSQPTLTICLTRSHDRLALPTESPLAAPRTSAPPPHPTPWENSDFLGSTVSRAGSEKSQCGLLQKRGVTAGLALDLSLIPWSLVVGRGKRGSRLQQGVFPPLHVHPSVKRKAKNSPHRVLYENQSNPATSSS